MQETKRVKDVSCNLSNDMLSLQDVKWYLIQKIRMLMAQDKGERVCACDDGGI